MSGKESVDVSLETREEESGVLLLAFLDLNGSLRNVYRSQEDKEVKSEQLELPYRH